MTMERQYWALFLTPAFFDDLRLLAFICGKKTGSG